MSKCIVYQGEDSLAVVLMPAPNCGLTVEQIALKDVPFGKPFKMIDVSDLPADLTQRSAWIVEDADLTDGIGADYGVGSEYPFVMPGAEQ